MPNEIRVNMDGAVVVMKLVSHGDQGWNYSVSEEDTSGECAE